jgi:hypothetical protein
MRIIAVLWGFRRRGAADFRRRATESFINYISLYNYMEQEILHYPRLDTVIMVEETIKKLDYYPTRMELWKALPKKVMYQTFSMIINYLISLGKIIIDSRDNRIVWVWNPELIKRINKEGLILK